MQYSIACINNRLQGVIDTIDASGAGTMALLSGSTVLVSITLAVPCGTVSGGVLTFSGTLQDTAIATGDADSCVIRDNSGANVVTVLTVGIPFSGADVIISNGLNSTLITTGDVVQVLSGQITGS